MNMPSDWPYKIRVHVDNTVQRRKLGFVARSKENWRDGVFIDFWEEKYKTQFILKWL